jgi:hypothetical protein
MDTEDFELMDSFLQPSAGTLQHLDITFGGNAYKCGKNYPQSFLYHQINSCAKLALPPTFSLGKYKTLRSLKVENVHEASVVPTLLKQITSTELKHLFLDWENTTFMIRNEFREPCDWSELGNVLAGDQFSDLAMVEIQFYVNNWHDIRAATEAEDEVGRYMPRRDGRSFHELKLKPLPVYTSSMCSW